MTAPEVRQAQPEDAERIANAQLEVWHTTFEDVLPEHVLHRPVDELAASWAPLLGSVLVAAEGEHLAGFVHLAPPEDSDTGEIVLLYVRPAWGRRGHGGRLLAASGAWLREHGATSGRWWVPITDVATQHFVRSVGWERTPEARAFDSGRAVVQERLWVGGLDFQLRG